MSEHRVTRPTAATSRADIARLHEHDHWPARWLWPLLAVLTVLQALAPLAAQECWPLLLLLWPAIGAVMFIFVLSFHDASHGHLFPPHWLNEAHGHFIGTMSFTPLAVYRYAHARHHTQLGREGDPELWPFNSPHVSRPLRVIAAVTEIFLGMAYTPLLFVRSVLVGELSPRERRSIVRGYLLCVSVWVAILAVVARFDLWTLFTVTWFVPMVIAGSLQTLNKFGQHLGLHGETVVGLSRTIVDPRAASELVFAATLYNNCHATHHRYAKIPFYRLPHATHFTLTTARERCPVFPSHVSATLDMLRCLADPKIGPQWLQHPDQRDRRASRRASAAPVAQPIYTGQYAA